MTVQFILGRSGTGKTAYCIQAIAEALLSGGDHPLILLVPEQATYQAERAILADPRIAGYHRLYVLSFDRLLFLLLGKNTARPALSQLGRQMLIQRLLRANRDRLRLLNLSAGWTGLARQVAAAVGELHTYAQGPEDIQQIVAALRSDQHHQRTARKFEELAQILTDYLQRIEGRFIDPDLQLLHACSAVGQARWLKGAEIWIDGFATFTPAELAVLIELLKTASKAYIALCLDPARIDLAAPENPAPTSLFYPTERTYCQLLQRIRQAKLELAEPIRLTDPVRFRSAALTHIEAHLFEPTPPKRCADQAVRIVVAPTQRAEVQFVARQIQHLVRQNNYRYRDIAVIAPELDSYRHYICAYFEDYRIPFFIDKPKPLDEHPAAQLISSALCAVIGGFTDRDVFAYLKNDLVPVDRRDVDLLESYCQAFGIRGDDWLCSEPWRFAAPDDEEFDQKRIDQIRLEVVRPLRRLKEALYPTAATTRELSAREFTQILFDFLDELQLHQSLSRWIQQAQQRRDFATAEAHQQFYSRLLAIFDEMVEVFADQTLSPEDYLAVLSSAFSQMNLALIPPTLDQVLVGSIERSRHPELKAVFLVGATQRNFPVPLPVQSLLTDEDRTAAQAAGIQLAPGTAERLAERQYLAYIAMTRASELLTITYPAIDSKSTALTPSQFVVELQNLFEDLHQQPAAAFEAATGWPYSSLELLESLCSALGKDPPPQDPDRIAGSSVLSALCRDPQLEPIGTFATSAINYDNKARLDRQLARQLFEQPLPCSATRLSTFAGCPYHYFARYVLELKPSRRFKLQPLDLGDFYHRILNGFLQQLNETGLDWSSVSDEQLLHYLHQQIEELQINDPFISNFVRRSRHNAFIITDAARTLEDFVRAIARMIRRGRFRPVQSEVGFGRVEDARHNLGPIHLDLTDGYRLSLDGRIDRIDSAELDGCKAIVVFDYKMRGTKFDWTKFYYGLDLQLPIYLLAVQKAAAQLSAIPVGAFYLPIIPSLEDTPLTRLGQRLDAFAYKASGLFDGRVAKALDSEASQHSAFYNFYVTKDGAPYGNYARSGALRPDDFSNVLAFTQRKIISLARRILSGTIDIHPYKLGSKGPCSRCYYKPLCRFDWQINQYNPLPSLGKSTILELIQTTDASGIDTMD